MTTATVTAYDAAVAYATERGASDGINAAGWYELPDTISARHDANAMRAIIRGIEDGDPAVLDTLPSADLSGQWADSLTGPALVADAVAAGYAASGGHYPHDDDAPPEWFTDVCDAYESAFDTAATGEIIRRIRYQTGE